MGTRNLKMAAFLLLLALTSAGGRAADAPAAAGGQGKFISGGVGEDSNARIQALTKDYNLRLLFAAKDGHYLADVAVTITDARGAKVLETVSEGPWLLTNLAPGKYEIAASYDGKPVTHATTIPASGRREIFFRWDEPPQ